MRRRVAYAQAKSQYETAQQHLQSMQSVGRKETVKGAAAQLESAKAKYEAAQAQLAYSEIRSPISGVIADRPVWPGEMANAGSPLLTVMNISSVVARVQVPQDPGRDTSKSASRRRLRPPTVQSQ